MRETSSNNRTWFCLRGSLTPQPGQIKAQIVKFGLVVIPEKVIKSSKQRMPLFSRQKHIDEHLCQFFVLILLLVLFQRRRESLIRIRIVFQILFHVCQIRRRLFAALRRWWRLWCCCSGCSGGSSRGRYLLLLMQRRLSWSSGSNGSFWRRRRWRRRFFLDSSAEGWNVFSLEFLGWNLDGIVDGRKFFVVAVKLGTGKSKRGQWDARFRLQKESGNWGK